jgi:hypothetical protein
MKLPRLGRTVLVGALRGIVVPVYCDSDRALPTGVEDHISQDIADFEGHPKNLYTITCTVIRPLEQLITTNPTLFVSLDPLELVSGAVESALLLAAALLCALLSLIFAAVFYYLRRRARSCVTLAAA